MEKKDLYEKSHKGPVLYIRHGETWYNKESAKKPDEDMSIRNCIKFLDCELSDKGTSQAKQLSHNLKNIKFKIAFSSPLMRCLQTTYLALRDNPQRENIRVIVHPLISETINGVHDYSRNIENKKKIFNMQSIVKFDWTLFDQNFSTTQSQDTYFLRWVDSCTDDNTYLKDLINKMKINCTDSLLEEFASYHMKIKVRPESYKTMFYRNLEFKDYLKDFLTDYKLDDSEKLVIFTHSSFSQISTSKLAYGMEKIDTLPLDSYKPSNCEIITMNI
jgi:phosphohistidine phosphatase SixA